MSNVRDTTGLPLEQLTEHEHKIALLQSFVGVLVDKLGGTVTINEIDVNLLGLCRLQEEFDERGITLTLHKPLATLQ